MSIIRSNIARQLLAEGGAPRKGFARGSGEGRTDADTMTGSGYTSSFDDGFGGGDEFARPTYSEQYAAMNVPDAVSKGGDNEPSFFQKAKNKFKTFETNARMNRVGRGVLTTPGAIKSVFGLRDVPPELLATLADDYTKGGLYSEGLVGGDISLENAASTLKGLEELGVDLTGDIRPQVANISRSKFAERFGPKTSKTEGGDNEPIKKLRAPITEKKEEESKGEFDDILQFYGARFAKGGRTDAESQYGADSAGSYSYADDGNRDDGGGPPTVMGGGDRPPSQKDLQGLRNQGLSDSKIAEMLGPLAAQYGLQQQQPEVLGVLGGAGPSVTFGQEVPGGLLGAGQGTKGTTGTTGLGDLQRNADVIADTIFDTGSLGGIAADALKANREAIEEAARGLKDGGAIRQNYGLGSIVKKAVGAVKKVAKSPIGKAALFAGLGAYGLGAGPFKGAGFGSGFLKSDAFKKLLLKKGKDEFTFGNLSPFSLLSIPTVASYLFSKKDEEEEELPKVANTDPAFQQYLSFYGGPRRFAQTGGDIDEAPMESMPRQEMASKPSSFAELNMLSLDLFGRPYNQLNDSEQEILMEYFSKSKDMPERTMAAGGGMMNPNDEMLNLGGNEMDLRGGGFVPLGEYEKKDDVPARLSKNEFVFTADAVKAAGGGSVDRGADIMYKTMKNLENKIA